MHPRLAQVVEKHLASRHRKPIAEYNLKAFARLTEARAGRRLVLDSFCGTGLSTQRLAAIHPEHFVVGIDQSSARLARHQPLATPPPNYLLLRAHCEPIWQLLREAGISVDFHYLLYPNPWPKPAHLGRRIHGHPGLADLLALGGQIELRSNWQLYVEEFGLALQLAGQQGWIAQLQVSEPITLFERKYLASGQALWHYQARLQPKVQYVSTEHGSREVIL